MKKSMSKRTKKFFATAALVSAFASFAFADTHETYKATSLQTPVGDISFGAWGRSTFEVGRSYNSTKITADATELGQQCNSFVESLVANGVDPTNETQVSAAVEAMMRAELTAQGVTGATQDAYVTAGLPEQLKKASDAIVGAGAIQALKAMEQDESNSKNFAALNPDWSYGSRVGFWIIGRTADQRFGFDFNLDSDARALFVHKLHDAGEAEADVNYNEDGKYAVAIGDQAKIWAQNSFDNLGFTGKIAFGKMRENYLRGSIGDFGQRESSDVKSEDDIFSEFWPTTGLFVSAKGNDDSALKGAYLAAAIDLSGTLGVDCADTDREEDMALYDALRTAQIGAGYTIPGIAQIKAQYWGDSISENNYKYTENKYAAARAAGYDMNDYYGRMEFGIDFLGFMGGANGLGDVDLDKTPNANLIELGFKVPIVTRDELREYDPEKFYNWYSCLGTMGVIQKGFILYKAHVWGGQGTSNLAQYTPGGVVTLEKGKGADIFMAGTDFLAEVCVNPFGKQDVFIGLSGNYNITSASGDDSTFKDLKLTQHNIGAEVYIKKTFGSNNYLFAGVAERFSLSKMDGTVGGVVDLSYEGKSNKCYMPIGIEMFF